MGIFNDYLEDVTSKIDISCRSLKEFDLEEFPHKVLSNKKVEYFFMKICKIF
jgi:hypothetical protein